MVTPLVFDFAASSNLRLRYAVEGANRAGSSRGGATGHIGAIAVGVVGKRLIGLTGVVSSCQLTGSVVRVSRRPVTD